MSTSDLYVLNQKSTTHLASFRNGWGSGPMCWDHLATKYLGEAVGMFGDMRRVWNLAGDDRLADHEKIAMMMTFDRAYVPLDRLTDAAEACEKFGLECEDGARVNHWPAFAKALREAAQQKFNRHARGVCLACTSVSDMWVEPSADYLSNAWSIYET